MKQSIQCEHCTKPAEHWLGYYDEFVELQDEIHVCEDCKGAIDLNEYNDYESIFSERWEQTT